MHSQWLEYLVDPKSGEKLQLEIVKQNGEDVVEGWLRSSAGAYPIVRGVPRFAGYEDRDSYVKSFSYQWTKWSRLQFDSENIGRPLEGYTGNMWQRITELSDADLRGAVVADFGCGPGRFIETVRARNGKVIGLDLSDAVDAAAESFSGDPNVLICQADVLAPPLRSGALDGAFSIGVLHHTPDPAEGVRQMSRVVKEGGWVAVAVYSKRGYYSFPTVQLYRRAFKALWPVFKHYPALAYSWFAAYAVRPFARIKGVGKAVRAVFPVVPLADPRWALLDTFDSVTPSYQTAHDSAEVSSWLQTNGLHDVRQANWGRTSFHAVK